MKVNTEKKTKKRIKETDCRIPKSFKIPKSKLENALQIIHDPNHPTWLDRNKACQTNINTHKFAPNYIQKGRAISNLELRLRHARTCLLRRDWYNLARIVLLYKPEKSPDDAFIGLFAKYASICLAYTNRELLEKLLSSFRFTESVDEILNRWTSIKQKLDE